MASIEIPLHEIIRKLERMNQKKQAQRKRHKLNRKERGHKSPSEQRRSELWHARQVELSAINSDNSSDEGTTLCRLNITEYFGAPDTFGSKSDAICDHSDWCLDQ
uniref:2b protein n=1 Tax=Tomato aspermy virus TaxID=12315 RepID=A0A2Z6E0X7_TAV|nr:2b protein [Tomato aspermy virus]